MPRDEAERQLLSHAGRALAVATASDLADYWRMPLRAARPRLAELAEAGELRPVRVEGWREEAWLHETATAPGQGEACALVSPFDPLIWFRPRTARLFGFDYRLEIFVLAAFMERACDKAEVAGALAEELTVMTRWLGLEQVVVGPRGGLARALKAAVAS